MSVHLNDLSKVYLQQIAEASGAGEEHEHKYKKSGKKSKDYDKDGEVEDESDEYAGVKDNAIKKATGKVCKECGKKKCECDDDDVNEAVHATAKQMHSPHEVPSRNLKGLVAKAVKRIDTDVDGDTDHNDKAKGELGEFVPGVGNKRLYSSTRTQTAKESFSNWRQDLREIIDTEEAQKPIKEKKVNNKVIVNPEIKEQIQIIESVELSEEYVTETIDSAIEYFIVEGLNEDGIEILIDELGLDEFVSFVFEVGHEVLVEARAGDIKIEPVTKGGKSVASLKGGPKSAAIKRLRKEKAARKTAEAQASASKPSGMKAALQSQSKTAEKRRGAVASAKEKQPSKKPVRDAIARGVFRAVDAYKAGMERHKKAMNLAKETGKTVAKAAAVTHEAGRRAGQSKVGQAVKKAGSSAIKAGVEKAKKDIKSLKKEEVDTGNDHLEEGSFEINPASHRKLQRIEKATKLQQGTKGAESQAAGSAVKRLGGSGINLPLANSYEPEGNSVDEVRNAYAVGMASAMKQTGDKPPLEKSTIKKAHKIAKAINKEEVEKGEQIDEIAPLAIGAGLAAAAAAPYLLKKFPKPAVDKAIDKPATGSGGLIDKMKQRRDAINQMNSYEPEGEQIDERRREDKGSKRSPEPSAAFKAVSKIMKQQQGGRGVKKVPGKKPPTAGQYGAPQSPAQKVAMRRAAAKRSQDNMSSRFD